MQSVPITTDVVGSTPSVGSCKSNYHTITATMAPQTVINGRSISADVTEDNVESIRSRPVSAFPYKMLQLFGLFDITE
jgi:hypothetical protein